MSRPYSLYVHRRPLRPAFIVDRVTADLQILTRIATQCQRHWGGRFNPIILSDGLTISQADWSLLRSIDPDVIKALVPMSAELTQQIEDRLSPFLMESVGNLSDHPLDSVSTDRGLGVPPTTTNLYEIFGGLGHSKDDRMRFVLFAATTTTDPLIDHFVQHNFGMYMNPRAVARALNEEGENVDPYVFELEDRAQLAAHLKQLAGSTKWIYPIQLHTYSTDIREAQHKLHVNFSVVIGDTAEDIALAWNHPVHLPGWQRRQIRNLWLPVALATDPDIVESLQAWLLNMADPWREGGKTVQFLSQSLEPQTLSDIAHSMVGSSLWPITRRLTEPDGIQLEADASHPRIRPELQFLRGLQSTEHFHLLGPDNSEPSSSLGQWMADLFIIMDGSSSLERSNWIRLPPRNRLAQIMFQKPSRIKLSGVASVVMTSDDPELSVRLLSSEEIIRTLITLENSPCFTFDARCELISKPFAEVRRSDKGRYLSGVIDLFGSLDAAYAFLEEHYWRNLFRLMSQKDPKADLALLETIKNKLKKEVRGTMENLADRPASIQRLAQYVLILAREHAPAGSSLSYARLLEHAKLEAAQARGISLDSVTPSDIDREDLRDDIGELLGRNILLAGIQQRCESCGTTNWHHVDDVRQSLECQGCGQRDTLQVDPEWRYRLNSLVQAAVARHGLVPVLLVLGEMSRWSSSFAYDTCLELVSAEGKSIGDLDVVALVQGKLIIGEIKESIDLFKPSDFSKMGDIAKRLKPSRVLFSSMCEQPNSRVQDQIEMLRATLQDQGIEVIWFQLPKSIFRPSEM